MKVSPLKAEHWDYEYPKGEKPGVWKGWGTTPICYRHYACGEYFTEKGERHNCKRWTTKHLKEMKRHRESKEYRVQVLKMSLSKAVESIARVLIDDSKNGVVSEKAVKIAEALGFKT